MKKQLSFIFVVLMITGVVLIGCSSGNLKLTINFNSNGGSSVSTLVYEKGKDFNMPDTPTKDDYAFAGWYTDNITFNDEFDANSVLNYSFSKNTEITVYARWVPETYTLYWSGNGGGGVPSDVITVAYGSAMPDAGEAPTRTGYTFTGYYDASSGGVQYYTSTMESARNWDKTANTTLYAQWTAIPYTVTFDKTGGEGGSNSVTATYGNAMPAATAPTRAGYTFIGYFDKAGEGIYGAVKFYNEEMSSTNTWTSTEDITLYARWSGNKYKVTFDIGSVSADYMEGSTTIQVTYGSAMPNNSLIVRSSYYDFQGYYDARNGGTQYYTAERESARNWDKMEDTTLYARWTGKSYDVSLNSNGGDLSGTVGVTYGSHYNLGVPTHSEEGRAFVGWFTKISGGNRLTNENGDSLSIWSGTSGITAYAQWDIYEYSNYEEGVEITKYQSSRESVTLPSYIDGKPVLSIKSKSSNDLVFSSSVKFVTLPNTLISIGSAAFHQTSLTNITIPSGVKSIGADAFSHSTSLTKITLPDTLETIGVAAFRGCNNLSEITALPSGLTSIGDSAFENCKRLSSITVNALTPPTTGDAKFFGTDIYVPADSLEAYKIADGWSKYAIRIFAQ